MEKLSKMIETKLIPVSNKISQNKVIKCMSGADDPDRRNHWNFPDTEERIEPYRLPVKMLLKMNKRAS